MTNLEEVLEKHNLWVKSYGKEGERANFYKDDLRKVDLPGANLEGANLAKINLSGANLYGANLTGANLSEANLEGVNLYRADLYRANLEGAKLGGANLTGASLYGADLSEANLREANLYGANLREANLSGANLYRAKLEKTKLEGANVSFTCVKSFVLSKNSGYAYKNNKSELMITIGCENHDVKYWLANYKKIGKKHNYTADEIYEYGMMINLLKYTFERSGK